MRNLTMGLEYTIVRDTHINDLIENVNKHLSEGWMLLGEVVLNDSMILQSMIRGQREPTVKIPIDNTSTKD
jgi:Mg2+/Co2+ transporter CorC